MQLVAPLLGILFVYLKLTGAIAWEWWLVLSPFWGALGSFLLFFVAYFVIVTIIEARR